MEKNFINFNAEKALTILMTVWAEQQGMKAPKVKLIKLTHKDKFIKQA